jgi:adenylate cyclase
LLCLGLWWLHRTLHYQFALVLPLVSGLAVCVVGFVIHASYGFFQEGKRRKHLVRLFGSYVSPDWVRQMARSQNDYSMQASNQVLTVMFCDMRGFTRLAGEMAPLDLQALLNDIFNRLSSVIQAHGGTIDKYMGDCVMAFWGAPQPQADHAARAVACAQDLIAAVASFNATRAASTPDIQMGIGINTGLVCVGDMGSSIRRSYTVIGDAVNLASRLEGLSKTYQVSVVVSSSTQVAAQAQKTSDATFAWTDLGSATIEGIASPVHIYTL